MAYRLDGPLFFAVAHRFLLELTEVADVRVVILRMSRISALDATGAGCPRRRHRPPGTPRHHRPAVGYPPPPPSGTGCTGHRRTPAPRRLGLPRHPHRHRPRSPPQHRPTTHPQQASDPTDGLSRARPGLPTPHRQTSTASKGQRPTPHPSWPWPAPEQFGRSGRQQRHRLVDAPPGGAGSDPETSAELRERLALLQVRQGHQCLHARRRSGPCCRSACGDGRRPLSRTATSNATRAAKNAEEHVKPPVGRRGVRDHPPYQGFFTFQGPPHLPRMKWVRCRPLRGTAQVGSV